MRWPRTAPSRAPPEVPIRLLDGIRHTLPACRQQANVMSGRVQGSGLLLDPDVRWKGDVEEHADAHGPGPTVCRAQLEFVPSRPGTGSAWRAALGRRKTGWRRAGQGRGRGAGS